MYIIPSLCAAIVFRIKPICLNFIIKIYINSRGRLEYREIDFNFIYKYIYILFIHIKYIYHLCKYNDMLYTSVFDLSYASAYFTHIYIRLLFILRNFADVCNIIFIYFFLVLNINSATRAFWNPVVILLPFSLSNINICAGCSGLFLMILRVYRHRQSRNGGILLHLFLYVS